MSTISIRGLTKYFGTRLVLDRVDLDVPAHQTVCLIGASGSGKSTLLRCINRLVEPDYGTITLDGRANDAADWGRTGLQQRVGIVFQSYNLFPHLSVLDNLTLAPRKVLRQPRAQAEARARDLLAAFAMDSYAQSYPEQLSGGQQQRVAIARAMMNDPDILLLDEVTAALDPELVGEVLRIIADLKARGLTMVIVTHEMGFARDVADKVCFLSGGRIVEEDTPDRLFRTPQAPETQAFLARIIASGRL